MLTKPASAGVAVALALCAGPFGQARAETFVEQNAEFRMQLDFVVPDAALRKFLPAGWQPNIATQGPAKDCNLRLIFIDRVDITGADGAPLSSSRLVYLAVPVGCTLIAIEVLRLAASTVRRMTRSATP